MVTDGLSYETPEIARLFYANTVCLRQAPNPPCQGPEYRYYEVRYAAGPPASRLLHPPSNPIASGRAQ